MQFLTWTMMSIESPPLLLFYTFFLLLQGSSEEKDCWRTPQTAYGGQLPFTGEPFQALPRPYNPVYLAAAPQTETKKHERTQQITYKKTATCIWRSFIYEFPKLTDIAHVGAPTLKTFTLNAKRDCRTKASANMCNSLFHVVCRGSWLVCRDEKRSPRPAWILYIAYFCICENFRQTNHKRGLSLNATAPL